MNIGPAQIVSIVTAGQSADRTVRAARPVPSLGDRPRVENSGAQKQASPATIPEDVVKVHSDTSTGQQIMVYEFVDPRSGSPVMQIPSKQMLSLVQGIRERLQQMAANQPGMGEVKAAEK